MNTKLTVSQLVSQIKVSLEGDFRSIFVSGEISNLSRAGSGHYYFTLSDANSSLSCALFKMDAMRNPCVKTLKNGDKVECQGGLGVYLKRGSFQLIIRRLIPVGAGDLAALFEQLKQKLLAEGLFDQSIKKTIPQLPKKVCVITAKGSAAFQDFLNIYKRRGHFMDILLVSALVQGENAPDSIRKALHKILDYSKTSNVDVIVITRGGGSIEDLWAFNDEQLVRDIAKCPLPVISAVGHQTDFTLIDFVSDLRVETPSAAAEILTQRESQITSCLNKYRNSLLREGKHILTSYRSSLERLSPIAISKLLPIREYQQRIDDAEFKMINMLKEKLIHYKYQIEKNRQVLSALGPKSVLNRGYSYLSFKTKIVSSSLEFDKIKKETSLEVHFNDGVRSVYKKEK